MSSLLAEMAGVEALFVLGIIANIIQVVDFSNKAIERVRESKQNLHDIPKAFRDVQTTLPLLANTLGKTKEHIKAGGLDEETCKALQPVLQDCQSRIQDLNDIFAKSLPMEGSSKVMRGWKAISSLGQDKKVEENVRLIWRHIPLLTYHCVAAPSITVDTVMAKTRSSPTQRQNTHFLVPIQWAEDFTGRQVQIKLLNSKLCHTGKHARVALVGLGGIGYVLIQTLTSTASLMFYLQYWVDRKTRLALQHAAQYKNSHDTSVFWIHAATAERMKKASREILKKANVTGWKEPQCDSLQLMKDWFESDESGKWLIVIDNADNIDLLYNPDEGRLSAYFPRSERGSILMTTRNRQIGVKFATHQSIVDLPALSNEESSMLLKIRLGDNPVDHHDRVKLAEALGGIPLALIQAVSYITENETTIVRYLSNYHSSDASKIHLLSENFEDDIRDPELKNPVAATWVVTFEYMKKYNSAAADTLCLMSMFNAQAIPESILSSETQDETVNLVMERALGVLQGYSLISPRRSGTVLQEKQGRSFDLHRLVRLVTRNWLTMTNAFDYWTAKAIETLSRNYKSVVWKNPESWSGYLPHAVTLLSDPKLQFPDKPNSVPVAFLGQRLRAGHTESGIFCQLCFATLLGGLATSYRENGEAKLSLSMIRKAAVMSEQALGGSHADTLDCGLYEAIILADLRDYNRSEQKFRETLAAANSILSPYHAVSLRTLREFGYFLNKLRRCVEAESLILQLIELCKEEYGEDDNETLDAMARLSKILVNQGRNEEATQIGLKISQIRDTVMITVDLADIFSLQKLYSEAEELYLRVLGHPDMRLEENLDHEGVLLKLGVLYFNQGAYNRAEHFLLSALGIRKRLWGESHRRTLEIMEYLAATYYRQGRSDDAERLARFIFEHRNELDEVGDRSTCDSRERPPDFWPIQGKAEQSEALALDPLASSSRILENRLEDYIFRVEQYWKVKGDMGQELPERL